MLADPGEVVLPECGARDDAEAIIGQPRDREVALDPAALVEHLGIGDGADGASDQVGAQRLEERGRALAADVDLRERRFVEDRDRLTTRAVLGTYGRRPVLTRPASRPQRLVATRRVRLEPVGALPARLLPE